MRDTILKLQEAASLLEPTATDRAQWNEQVLDYANEFIETMDSRKAYEKEDTSALIDKWDFKEEGRELNDIMNMLRTAVDKPGINPASGGHIGYIPGGGVYPAALGDYLVDVTNRYAGIYFANPGAVRLENKLIRWMSDLIGYPSTAHGNLTSGGSIANLIGITCARDAMHVKSADIPELVIYMHSQTHHCVHKSIAIAGLSEATLRQVPLDANYRMSPQALESMIVEDKELGLRPFLIVASLGSTDTGAVDPIDAIADIRDKYALWLHVDAAYGGFFVLLDQLKEKFRGVSRPDSFVVDPHKGMFMPYGLGAFLVRDREQLYRSHAYHASYMQDAADSPAKFSPAQHSPELTKHFRGMRMWLPMQMLGLAPFRAALKEKLLLARYFYREIASHGFDVGPEPELSVVIYRYTAEGLDADVFNARLIKAIQSDGRIFISSTVIDGDFWLRLAVLSFRTHLWHIDLLIETLVTERDRLLED